jgi:hypothetical protein
MMTNNVSPQWSAASLERLREFGRWVIREALKRGKSVKPGGEYEGSCVCWLGAAFVLTPDAQRPRDPYPECMAEPLGLATVEAYALESGFCGWSGTDTQPQLYALGASLAAELPKLRAEVGVTAEAPTP